MANQAKLVGISSESIRFSYAGFGMSGLWDCVFSGYDCSWNENHYSRVAAILLGGWKDALSFDNIFYIQRIFLGQIPSLDTARVSVERVFPVESVVELDFRGFVGSSGDFYFHSPYLVSEHKANVFKINYHNYDAKNINIAPHTRPEETRKQKFDLICGVWLADGRIFAENNEIVASLLRLGILVARLVHNGMWWTTIEEKREQKMMV